MLGKRKEPAEKVQMHSTFFPHLVVLWIYTNQYFGKPINPLRLYLALWIYTNQFSLIVLETGIGMRICSYISLEYISFSNLCLYSRTPSDH